MHKLRKQLEELESKIPMHEMQSQSVSMSTVGWQIDHILLTTIQIAAQLQKSAPEQFKPSFSFWKMVIFTTKNIPRGRAKAPKAVDSKEYSLSTLKDHLKQAKDSLDLLEKSDPNQFMIHPFFGNLRLADTIKFMYIHNNHHLKIIADIIKAYR